MEAIFKRILSLEIPLASYKAASSFPRRGGGEGKRGERRRKRKRRKRRRKKKKKKKKKKTFLNSSLSIIRQTSINLSRNTTRNNLQNFTPKIDSQSITGSLNHIINVAVVAFIRGKEKERREEGREEGRGGREGRGGGGEGRGGESDWCVLMLMRVDVCQYIFNFKEEQTKKKKKIKKKNNKKNKNKPCFSLV